MDWCKVYLSGTRQGQEVDYSEHGKGTSGSIKWEKFLDWLQTSSLSRLCSVKSNYWLKHTQLNRISYGRLSRLDIISAVTLRSLVVPTVKSEEPPRLHLHLYREDGGRMFLSNNSIELRDYTAAHHRLQHSPLGINYFKNFWPHFGSCHRAKPAS